MAPWGGVNLTGTQSVTLNNLQGGSLYYTTDGTTPSATNGTLYSAPFNVTVPSGGTATVKAASTIQQGISPADAATGHFRGYGFKPNDTWYDVSTGVPMQA